MTKIYFAVLNCASVSVHTYFFATGITKSTLKLSKKRTNKFDFAVLACASVNIFLSSLTLLFSQTHKF